jgi:hypothetical protein
MKFLFLVIFVFGFVELKINDSEIRKIQLLRASDKRSVVNWSSIHSIVSEDLPVERPQT